METDDGWGRLSVVTRRDDVFPTPILVLTCSGGVARIYTAVGEETGVLSNIAITLEHVESLSVNGFSFGCWGCRRENWREGCEPANVFGEHLGWGILFLKW